MRDCKGVKILLAMSFQPWERGPPILTGGLLESEIEPYELSAEFVFAVPVSSMLGFLSLPLHCVFFPLSLHCVSFCRVGLRSQAVLGLRLAGASLRLFCPG